MKSRQAVLRGPQQMEIEDVEIEPPEDHLLVQMQGTGLCTSEMPLWQGMRRDYPAVLGHEGWGVVVDKGTAVSDRVPIGARVTGLPMRCLSDYFVQPEWCTMVVDSACERECLLGEPWYCVGNVVRAARPELGDCLVLVGMGPMGQWALQALASPSLQAVVAVDVDDEKLRMARSSGATHCINSQQEDALAVLAEITGGRMADVVIEGSGVKPGMDLAVQMLRRGHPRRVVMSFFKRPIEVDITRLCGVSAEVVHAHPGITKDRPDHCRRIETLINKGVFNADHLISHRFTLEQAAEGYHALEHRPDGYVKGIVTP